MTEGPGVGPGGDPRAGRHWGLAVVSAAAVLAVVAALLVAWQVDRRDPGAAGSAGAPSTAPAAAAGSEPSGGSIDAPDGSVTPGPGATTSTTAPVGPKAITLAFAGDLLPHGPVNASAARYGDVSGRPYDFTPMLAPMAPIIGAADVAICHMEVPVAPPGQAVTTYPSFGAPPELVDAVRDVGFDGCSNASNHSLDRGRAGIDATLDRFDQDHLKHAGTARTATEAASTTVYDVGGAHVAHLSYAYGFNGYPVPADAPWAVNRIDVATIAADAARARREGADIIAVSLHWGTEYHAQPDAYQRDIAAQLLPSPDIDVIIGAHAHVVQPIEEVEGTFVVWGMGNQLSNQSELPRRDGLTVRVTAERDRAGSWEVAGVEAIPTWVDKASFRVLPVVATLADPATPAALRAELRGSYERTAAVLDTPSHPGVALAPEP